MLNPALKLLVLAVLVSLISNGSSKISSFQEAFRGSGLDRSLHLPEKSTSQEQHRMAAFGNLKSSKSKETEESRDISEVSLSQSIFFRDKAEESMLESSTWIPESTLSKSEEDSKAGEVSESIVSAFRNLKSSKSNKTSNSQNSAKSNTDKSEDSSFGEEKVKSTSKS